MKRSIVPKVLITTAIAAAIGYAISSTGPQRGTTTASAATPHAGVASGRPDMGHAPDGTRSSERLPTGTLKLPPPAAAKVELLTTASLAGLSLHQLLGRIEPSMTATGVLAWNRVRELARSDPAVLKDLIGLVERETDATARQALLPLLAGLSAPDVVALAQRLASGDPAQRQDGYTLLGSQYESATAHGMLLQALDAERDPALLGAAIQALRPATVEPRLAEATIQKLDGLARDTDPRVRAASLQALAQWDKAGNVAEPALYQALGSPDADIRRAATSAVLYGNQLNTDRLKVALMDVLQRGDPEAQVMAMTALNRFQLSQAEAATLTQMRSRLQGTPTGG